MKNNFSAPYRLIPFLALCSLLPWASYGEMAVPPHINYQGLLTSPSTTEATPPGMYTLAFRIWSDAMSTQPGHLVWGRAFEVAVVEGRFNVMLSDDGAQLDDHASQRVKSLLDAFADAERYLGITVMKAPQGVPALVDEIIPRQKILSTPYAFMSATVADNAITYNKIAEKAIINSKIDIGAISTENLQNETVTYEKLSLGNGSIPGEKISQKSITSGHITDKSISVNHLADNLQKSTSPITWSVNSGGWHDVPGSSVTLISNGSPLYWKVEGSISGSGQLRIVYVHNGQTVTLWSKATDGLLFNNNYSSIYISSPGEYTFKVQFSSAMSCTNMIVRAGIY